MLMPKKTRQEKIIADLRRKLETVKTPGPVLRQPLNTNTSYLLPTTPTLKQDTTQKQVDYFITKDLRKTFILAGLAISFEIIVYLIGH